MSLPEDEISDLNFLVIPSLIELMDLKDQETIRHSSRVQKYVADFIPDLVRKKIIRQSDEPILWVAAILHDVGKIFVHDAVLGSPRSLSEAEYEHVRGHPARGYNLLVQLGVPGDILQVVRHHHERWDGRRNGRFPAYPDGLKGKRIPLFARIVALADTYDALVSDRPYKPGYPPARARAIISRNLGSQFDPRLGRLFLTRLKRDAARERRRGKVEKKEKTV